MKNQVEKEREYTLTDKAVVESKLPQCEFLGADQVQRSP